MYKKYLAASLLISNSRCFFICLSLLCGRIFLLWQGNTRPVPPKASIASPEGKVFILHHKRENIPSGSTARNSSTFVYSEKQKMILFSHYEKDTVQNRCFPFSSDAHTVRLHPRYHFWNALLQLYHPKKYGILRVLLSF